MDNDVLRQAPLFSSLDDEAATALGGSMAETKLRRGDVLFHEGDSGDKLYVVTEGKVKLGRVVLRRPREPPRDHGPRPDVRRALALRPRPALGDGHRGHRRRLRARCPTTTCCAGSTAARRSPAACSPSSPRRLRKSNDVVADLVFSDVPGRVAKALLDLADRFGRTADDGVHVHHDLTQEELAQLVGASRETVNKALADFASRGWLRLEPRSVVIMDVERLSRRAR